MDFVNYKETIQWLRNNGLSALEINRLIQLRKRYAKAALEQTPVDYNRLEFIRWLIAHGRLTN